MNSKMQNLLKGFRKLRVLVLGESILDVYVRGTASRICREAPVPIVDIHGRVEVPGGAANTAVNITTLGATAYLLSVIGYDGEGRTLMHALSQHGVESQQLILHPERKTQAKYRILADEQLMLRIDSGSTELIDSSTEQLLIERLEELYQLCDAVIVSDYQYGIVTPKIIEALGTLQQRMPKILVVDSKNLEAYKNAGVTAVKPNYMEAAALLGLNQEAEGKGRAEQIAAYGKRILDITGARIAAITMDSEGACIFERNRSPFRTYAQQIPNPQTAGAGDTFASALTLALARKATARMAADLASAAAAITIQKHGTTPCYIEELEERFSNGSKQITDTAQLQALVRAYKQEGKRVVFTNGCFDILHSGHVAYLNQARELGDVLIVGLNTDISVRRLKGSQRPVNSLEERSLILSGLSSVDHIVAFGEDTPVELIKLIQPDIFVKGGDYTRDRLPEAELVEQLGGRIEILPYIASRSTTGIIERIRQSIGTAEWEAETNVRIGVRRDNA